MATPTGKHRTSAKNVTAPRTPLGLSVTLIAGIHNRSTGAVCHTSDPANTVAFSVTSFGRSNRLCSLPGFPSSLLLANYTYDFHQRYSLVSIHYVLCHHFIEAITIHQNGPPISEEHFYFGLVALGVSHRGLAIGKS